LFDNTPNTKQKTSFEKQDNIQNNVYYRVIEHHQNNRTPPKQIIFYNS